MLRDELDRLARHLPEVPGIQGRHEYFNSAILVPFVWIAGEYHLLFQVRAKHIRQGREVCFPGGGYDADLDSSYRDTALRETEEEIGIAPDRVTVIGRLDTLVVPMGAALEPYVGRLEIESVEELTPDPGEVERLFTIPVAHFLENDPEKYAVRVEVHPTKTAEGGGEEVLFPAVELGLPERYHTSWGAREVPVFVYRTEEGVIWGMTAEIIKDLVRYLR